MMASKKMSGLSAWALPVTGLLALSLIHAHPSRRAQNLADGLAPSQMLLQPDPRMNDCFRIFLRQQYRNVAQDRARLRQAQERDHHACTVESALFVRERLEGLRQSIADYNLLAQESDFGVFQATGLPNSLTL